ncbi:MarR family winged helix-turn-helix transcriptional regulator [Reyranella sp.]|uniref:MarR family winged helix-turn-helix transcriptional regulator n=1 Tax=Reyranella sp. TaxID=1929291 RepID=UPI003783B448
MTDPEKDGPAPPLAFRIVNWIGILDQLTSTEANRLLKPLGLGLPQFVLLNHFSHRPEEARTVTDIARALQQPQPGVTKTVQKLVDKGWLGERVHGRDGRSKLLVLTASGKARHRAAIAVLMPSLSRAFADWSARDQQTLFTLLDRLKVWFDRDRDPTDDSRDRRAR